MKIRLAALNLNQIPLDWRGNRARLLMGLEEARAQGAQLVLAPELSLSGYGAEDAFLWPDTSARALASLKELLPATRGLVVSCGLPLSYQGKLYNTAALIKDGRLLGLVAKKHLAGAGIHYEQRWFTPWPVGKVVGFEWEGERHLLGDLLFELGSVRLGFEICEDAWVDDRPGLALARAGADLVLNPSASHFAFGKHAVRRKLVKQAATELGLAYLYVNLQGNEAGRAIYDGDTLFASEGRVVSAPRRFGFSEYALSLFDWDVRAHRAYRQESLSRPNSLRWSLPAQGSTGGAGYSSSGAYPGQPSSALGAPLAAPSSAAAQAQASPRLVHSEYEWMVREVQDGARVNQETAEEDKFDVFTRAVALGLFDYARKSRSRGYVVSLSGGVDSAACAVLVRMMLRLACLEHGVAQVSRSFGLSECLDENELATKLLLTVYQATAQSGPVTRRAAAELAQALCSEHHEFEIEGLVRSYRALSEQALGRELSWESDDLALQNIQARVRSPSVWMLANLRGALLLSTSNRSEAAVGYATMDGDTSGGLSPLAGIDKAWLRKWLLWMQTTGLPEWGPMPVLALVNEQAPTAELRPESYAQTDEKDLMPYEVLDVIERAFTCERLSPQGALEAVVSTFPQMERSTAIFYVRRFFQLFTRNQWKRERYAPSFHLDDANLDPKTWLRFPILSSGYAEELEALV